MSSKENLAFNPSDSSVQFQRSPAYFALVKAANTIGYLILVHLTWRFLTGRLDWQLSTGCVVVSGCWLALTRIKVDHLLQTYFDVLSRIEMELPILVGIITSVVALFAQVLHPIVHVAALGEIAGWLWIFLLYRRNKSRFKKQGYGPVPKDTWVDPPASALKSCDLILTSGNIAKGLHESVGHAEMVLQMGDGRWMLFSSYMDKGANLHPLEDLTGPNYEGHYVGLHLAQPISEEKKLEAASIAEKMVATNKEWAKEENERIAHRINWLPLPAKAKAWLQNILTVTGYDWFGTFMGRIAPDRWTCIGAAVELYHRIGVKTNYYGTGLLGFGTTLFDPILPVRFLADPAFTLITADHRLQSEQKLSSPVPGSTEPMS